MIKAVQQISKFNGYSMILYYTEAKKNEEINALKMLREHFADGMILINFSFTSEHLKEINRINHPLVLSGICTSSIGAMSKTDLTILELIPRKVCTPPLNISHNRGISI